MLNSRDLTTPLNKLATITFAILLAIVFSKSSFCEEKSNIKFIDDIPVMDTMNIEPEFSFSFDSPSGRIVILIATSSDYKEQIMQFYRQVMPQLGWKVKEKQYERGDEKFQIVSSNNQDSVIWRLSITPLHK